MNRLFVGLTIVIATFSAPEAQADIVVSTIDPIGFVSPDILRIDEETGTNLTAATIPTGSGGLGYPTDIAVGADGNIYASDNNLAKVLRFDGTTSAPLASPVVGEPDGVFATRSAPIDPNSFFQTSTSLTFGGPSGDLFVVQQDLGVIEVYDSINGSFKGTLLDNLDSGTPSPVTLASAAFTPTGELLASDLQGSRIYKIDLTGGLTGEVVTEFVAGTSSVIVIDNQPQLFFPAGMGTDSSGNVYVANIFGNNILKFDSSGQNPEVVLTIPGELTEPNLFNPQLPPSHFPSDVIVENDDSLLLAILGQKNTLDDMGMPQDTEGRVLRVDLSTATPTVDTLIEDLLPVTSVALIDDLLPGDYNGDGTVDTDDYAAWKSQFGATVVPGSGADGNEDGIVNLADYSVWRNTLGATALAAPSPVGAINVPEPSSVFLLGTLLGCLAGATRLTRHTIV